VRRPASRSCTRSTRWSVALVFGVVYVAVTALSLPGATILTLVAARCSACGSGTLVASFASSIGATLAMLVARYVLA
jgi:uncharacterized membrane protein YdjX (TVP38/TMEM64 family)